MRTPRFSQALVATLLAGMTRVLAASPEGGGTAPPSPQGDHRAGQGQEAGPSVALTFDDLPVHANLPPGMSRADVARSVLATLKAHHAPPTYGFVNAKGLDGGPDTAEVLRLWRASGNPLANHSFSHMDLNANSVEAFEKDVLADEAVLRAEMSGADWHFFRYPFLHEGDTLLKRRAVRSFLSDHGYKVAQVTLNFDDYAYNDPYARCVAASDATAVEDLKESYLRRAKESLAAGQEAAKRIFGRDIPHVMLLHIGAFETVMLPQLLDLLEQSGFRLSTLGQVETDPAYSVDPGEAALGGGPFLSQMMAAKHIPQPETTTPQELSRIGQLCR